MENKDSFHGFIERLGETGLRNLFFEMKKEQYGYYKDFFAKCNSKHLDIGSGDGITCLFLKKQNPEVSIQMLDIKDLLTEEAKETVAENLGLNYRVYQRNSRLPFEEKSFGSVSLFYVLHHLGGKKEAGDMLEEARRVLSDEGYLIILEEPIKGPGDGEVMDAKDKEITKMFLELDDSFKTNYFYEWELEDLFKQARFSIIKRVYPTIEKEIFPRTLYVLRKDENGK